MLFNNMQADIYILSYLPAMHINITNLAIFSEKNSLQHLETIKSVFQTIGIALELELALDLALELALELAYINCKTMYT